MMIRTFCLTALLALTGWVANAQTFTVETLINNGRKANRINLAILADGYTASQQTQFVSDATTMINQFFNTPPLSLYKSFFNVYAVRVVSTQSGAKHPGTASDCYTANPAVPNSTANPYFGATFDYGGTHRLLYCTNTASITQVLSANTPFYDKALILVNTPYYGGSGGNYSIGSVHPSSAEIMIHEFGHSFAGLADEYGGSYCGGNPKPNVTQDLNPLTTEWKEWLTPGAAVPTPANTNCSYTGLYNGGNYCTSGWYRPACDCKMRTLNQPLCSVCKQEFIVKIMSYVNLIDIYAPTSTAMTLNTGAQTFSAQVLQPIGNTVKRVWKLNGNTVATNVNSFTVNASSLMTGSNTLTLSATDTTLLCRVPLPTHSVTWTITKSTTGVVATLAALAPVCSNASSFSLTGGLPIGGVYSGNGVSGGVFNPAAAGAGTHTITYTVSGVSASQTITVNPIPVIGGSSSASVCVGSTVNLSASGGSAYSWSPSTGLNATTSANVVASPSSNITYTVTASANGCVNTKAIPVTTKSLPSLTASSNTSVCPGNSTSLSASGASTYAWSPAATLNTSNGTSVTATPSASTTYTVVGTGSNGCSASKTVTVSVTSAASINISGNFSICNGSSASLIASGAASYTWAPSTGLNTTSGASVSASPTSTTTYTVTGSLGGCTAMQTAVVSVGSLGNVTATGNAFICTGGNTTLTATGASNYAWAPSTGLNNTTGSTVIASPASSTTYTVTASTGSCSTTKTVAVAVNAAPVISGLSTATLCSGNSTALSVSGANSYAWAPSTGLSATTGASVNASPTSSITYTVTGYGAGCSSTKTIGVIVNGGFTMTVNNPSVSVCNGTAAALVASGATTYSWAPSTGLSATTGASVSALPYTNVTYTVTGIKNGCTQIKTIAVSLNSAAASITSGTNGLCSGGSTTLSATGGTAYTWAPSAGLSATTGSAVTAAPTVNTTYTVTASSNGCTGTATKVIGVTAAFTIGGSSNTSICVGTAAALSATGADAYTWSPATGLSVTTGASVTASPTATTTYTVTGTKGFCVKTKTIVVTVKQKPTLATTVYPAACGNANSGAVDLSVTGVTGTVSYLWSNGATTQDLNGIQAGAYAVTATAAGCSATAPASVAGASCTVPTQYFAQNILSNGATLRWKKVACGVSYMVRYKTAASGTWSYVMASDTSVVLTGLTPSTNYQYEVQTYCNPSLTDMSGFGSTQAFATAATSVSVCSAPVGLSTTNMTFQSATLNWGSVGGASAYKVRIRRSNNSDAWQEFVVQAPATSYSVTGLTNGAAYKWQVLTMCNASGTSASAYSSLVYFTTFSGREGEDETNVAMEAEAPVVNVFPNPSFGPLTVTVEQTRDAEATLELYNTLGQLLRREDIQLLPGTTTVGWNIGELPAGTYVLYLRQQSGVSSHKVVKQ
ncbi:MAG TPA: M64 family metallopeptidase [Chitinophagales bacterium]|nr:M64 family metallopeptidase [Chitinophagales bacterium]